MYANDLLVHCSSLALVNEYFISRVFLTDLVLRMTNIRVSKMCRIANEKPSGPATFAFAFEQAVAAVHQVV